MFLTPITVQESYLTGFLTTLPLLVVVTETADLLVETPEAGTETIPPDLVARTLADTGWTTEELFGTSEGGLQFHLSRVGSLVGASEAGFLVGASETETLPLGATPSGCCCRDRLAEISKNGAVRNGYLVCLRCVQFFLYTRLSSVRT